MSVIHGDCLEVMATLDAESIDAIVTDPPYGLEFMGVAWDTMRADGTPRPRNEWGDFGSREHPRGPHDAHRVGRKKSLALQAFSEAWATAAFRVAKPGAYLLAFGGTRTVHRMTCAIEDAGWIIRDMLVWAYASGFPKGRANLKPAWEPIVMARKPGPLRALNIDECRIGMTQEERAVIDNRSGRGDATDGWGHIGVRADGERFTSAPSGRWPANVVLTDPIFDGGWDGVVGGGESASGGNINGRPVTGYSKGWADERWFDGYEDKGTYSRYFLIPKASRAERVLSDGRRSPHPTQKPVELMRHLVRLVTPSGGVVLDPFLGSGTTALAAEQEGFAWIGVEKDAEYAEWANDRLNDGTQKGMAL